MAEGPSPVPAGAGARLFAEPEPDRAAVEVPQGGGVEPLARDARGDAGGGGGRAGSPGRFPGRVGEADDGAAFDGGGGASVGLRPGVGGVPDQDGSNSIPPRRIHEICISRAQFTSWDTITVNSNA